MAEGTSQTHLSEALGLGMLLKTKCWEMDTRAEDSCLGKDTDTANTVQLHLHVRIAVGVAEIGQMRPPRRVLRIAFHNHRIFVQSFRKSQCCL
jgi:hypothetical protein